MKKYLVSLFITAALLVAGCSDGSGAFYSVSYPVVRVDAEVVGPASGDETSGEATENPIFAQIAAEIVAQAPVQAGGGYHLDFTAFNGGPATVRTAAEAEPVTGTFVKAPGSDNIQFIYGEEEYTCTLSSYDGENNRPMVCLTVDLTARYQALYPEAGITRAMRLEYTSTPAN